MAHVSSLDRLRHELEVAGDRLVVLEVMKERVCETGLLEADDGWTPDRYEREQAKLRACEGIHHQFTRMACDSPHVRFLEAYVRSLRHFLHNCCKSLALTVCTSRGACKTFCRGMAK